MLCSWECREGEETFVYATFKSQKIIKLWNLGRKYVSRTRRISASSYFWYLQYYLLSITVYYQVSRDLVCFFFLIGNNHCIFFNTSVILVACIIASVMTINCKAAIKLFNYRKPFIMADYKIFPSLSFFSCFFYFFLFCILSSFFWLIQKMKVVVIDIKLMFCREVEHEIISSIKEHWLTVTTKKNRETAEETDWLQKSTVRYNLLSFTNLRKVWLKILHLHQEMIVDHNHLFDTQIFGSATVLLRRKLIFKGDYFLNVI